MELAETLRPQKAFTEPTNPAEKEAGENLDINADKGVVESPTSPAEKEAGEVEVLYTAIHRLKFSELLPHDQNLFTKISQEWVLLGNSFIHI